MSEDPRRRPDPATPDARPDARPAVSDDGDLRLSRRGFLEAAGFVLAGGAAAGALSGCARPAPVLSSSGAAGSDDVTPGRSTWYATTCGGCTAGCGLVVRCRDGRPVKVEGNPDHPVSRGGVCAVGQASVLELYDSKRCLHPTVDGVRATTAEADARVRADLARVAAAGGAIRVLTGTVNGPSTRAALRAFTAAFPTARHVAYDALSSSAALASAAQVYGMRALPRVRLERAETILGIECDFLGAGVSPVEHTRGWRAGRTLEGTPPRLSRHVQVESALTLTGSNADRRVRVEAAAVPAFVAHLAARLCAEAGLPSPATPDPLPVAAGELDALVRRLLATRGRSVVLCDRNDVEVQKAVALCNEAVGAHGTVLDLAAPSWQRTGDDAAFAALLEELEAGRVAALVVAGCDPVADTADGARFAAATARVGVRVGLASRPDATTAQLSVVLPLPHRFETFDDDEPVAGVVSLSQPLLRPFGEPRSLRASLAAWTGADADEQALVRAAWERDVAPRLVDGAEGGAERTWRAALRRGFALVAPSAPSGARFRADVAAAASPRGPAPTEGFTLHAIASPFALDGRTAHNPWLLELPDAVTKQTWGNALLLSASAARTLRVADGDRVRVEGESGAAVLPALVLPGMPERTVAAARGFGRRGTDRFASIGPAWIEAKPTVARGGAVGAAVEPLLRREGGAVATTVPVRLSRAGGRDDLARSQDYHSLDMPAHLQTHGGERRDAVRETTLAALARDRRAGNPAPHAAAPLWADEFGGGQAPADAERWRLVVDLAACTGCSACVVSCQAENNVPVVGRDEVSRHREMAWLRIDRYVSERPEADGAVDVVFQPMLCQHCEHAPCETVCPVLATVHTEDGLNAQVYNRCVGTRYCANNCPYKVRRFNWFDYERHDRFADLVLNPDVTVRSRGVMEKCSFCVQRLAEARVEARRLGRPLADGEAKTACQQSCPASAIVFGNAADPKSRVAQVLANEGRHYRVLEELNVRPAVGYLTKVRHRDGGDAGGGGGDHHG